MPKRIAPLTIQEVEHATPKEKEYKMADGYGLYLLITPAGSKLWRMKYRFHGKQKSLCFGSYPSITMDEARTMRNDAKILIKTGVDPSEIRRQLSAAEKLERISSKLTCNKQASVRVDIDGFIEIWRGRVYVKLSNEEAIFIKNQLSKLLD